GVAVISLDLASTATCPRVRPLAVAQALTRCSAPRPVARRATGSPSEKSGPVGRSCCVRCAGPRKYLPYGRGHDQRYQRYRRPPPPSHGRRRRCAGRIVLPLPAAAAADGPAAPGPPPPGARRSLRPAARGLHRPGPAAARVPRQARDAVLPLAAAANGP